ncbi:solute carrier family 26 member 6-like [Brachionus plicatilis]|uniref:Solute carrier family 26 member 6-like n=1 Tax=Brachionus plicatilis TaxID=10195 RepID=A0A3M7QTL5_BRAPC|nr:solute carrier family 26 member 6-like [Brachionus plicatilis]
MQRILFWKKNIKKEEIKEYREDESLSVDININRPTYNHAKFHHKYKSANFVGFSIFLFIQNMMIKSCSPGNDCFKKNLINRFPAWKWIRNYNFKEWFLADLLAGITVGIMHIPESMGYALLVNIPPIYGLYSSFFPALIYWIFGTSRQISIGTLAIVALMVGTSLSQLEGKYAPPEGFNKTLYEYNLANNISQNIDASNYLSLDRDQAKVLIVMATTFWVGIIQIVMFFFQLGFLTSYLSEPLVNGFLAGSAIHVLTSQLKSVLGITTKGFSGAFKIPKTYIDIFSNLSRAHLATVLISLICITILMVIKIHINERYSKKMTVPFPTELLIVIFGTMISHFAKFSENFDVKVIGPIQAGIPPPQIPPLFIVKDMIIEAFLIAIVSFAINFSLCDLFSKMHRYKINTTQELFAYGAIALVLGFIAPLFQALPQACLASIIIASLKNLLLKIFELKFYWKINKLEFIQFLTTFVSVVILDVEIGLGVGVVFYIIAHLVRSSQPYATILGNIYGTELYRDIKLYKDAHEIEKIKIVRIQSDLHATNSAGFKKSIYELTDTKPQEYMAAKMKILDKRRKKYSQEISTNFKIPLIGFLIGSRQKKYKVNDKCVDVFVVNNRDIDIRMKDSNVENIQQNGADENYMTEYEMFEHQAEKQNADTESQMGDKIKGHIKLSEDENEFDENSEIPMPNFNFLIIDCSPINFIDSVGVKTIKQLIMDYNEIGVNIFLADCNDAFIDRLRCMTKATDDGHQYFDETIIHLTIHDAVTHALNINKRI